MQRSLSLFAALLLASPTLAVVIPNDRENVAGTATFLGPLSNAQRTYQLLIHESQLTSVVNQPLVGLMWRLPTASTAAYPTAPISYTNFDIRLSGSVDPANRSLTFANNVVGTQTLVRSGPLTVNTGAYTVNVNPPHPWGPVINFDQPYLYTGGNLLIEFRHTGFSGTSSSVDAIGTAVAPYGTGVSAAWTSSYTGTTGAQGNAIITQLLVPEPGLAAIGFGCVALLARRQPRR